MKLNNQVLRSRSVGPLNSVEYLDLSNLGIVSVGERLSSCSKLTTLILAGNKLQDASGFDVCEQLWHLDLSNNKVQSVEALSRFLALGTLVLSNNQLSWPDLANLRHTNILSLSLHGNQELEKDPYYRIHVIDCLPNVWMLDGRIITSAERIQVSQFFQDSALTDRPVRRKLRKDGFVPTKLKKIEIDGIFGTKASQMMTSFPKNGVLNIEMDWKRLHYLVLNLQEDINLQWQYTAKVPGKHRQNLQKQNFLTDLFDVRPDDRERCNMVLLMLVASLDFVLPTHLVKDTLETGKLSTLGKVHVMDLFLLPRSLRCKLVALLVSAVKVDREQNEDGGLYTKLYLCLYHMVSELTRLSEGVAGTEHLNNLDSKLAAQLRDFKCLLATEVVQLMCIVPSFFDYLDRDIGVMNLVRIATADPDINEKLIQISGAKADEEDDKDKVQNDVFKIMADFLLMKVQEQLQNLTNKPAFLSSCDRILSKSSALPMKGHKSPICKAEYLVRGVCSPDDDPPAINPRKMSAKTRTIFPHLGDRLLLGPQTVGKIISLPQPTMALVIIDAVPVASGAVEHKLKESEQHYTYVNMDQLEWDTHVSMWKPKGTVGDKYTLQASSDFNKEANMSLALETYRPGSPENVYAQDSQVARSSTPLFFTNTPRKMVFVPTESSSTAMTQSKMRRPQRPLSSVYKERLKLSLDLSRRAKSAGARRPFTVKYGPKSAMPKKPSLLGDTLSGMKVDLKGVALEVESGGSNPPSVNRLTSGQTMSDRNTQRSNRSAPPVATSTPKHEDRGEKENKSPLNTNVSACGQKPHQLPAGENEEDHGTGDGSSKPVPPEQTTKPQAEESRAETGEKSAQDPKEIFLTALNESPQTFDKCYSGYQLAGRSRPVSAVERQVKIKKPMDNIYHTEFQQQRIDAWKHATRSSSQPKLAISSEATPPQPPPSPIPFQSLLPPPPPKAQDNNSISTSNDTICTINIQSHAVNKSFLQRRIPNSNLWLAGGRDLFWEKLKGRPKSGHTPGWKEGLPESMKPRPRSAAARFNRSKNSAPHTPASTRKDPAFHGTMMLNELADLPDTKQPGMPIHMMPSLMPNMTSSFNLGRRYSSQRSLYDEDPLPGPVPENIYR